MNCVIDAQVVGAFYREEELGESQVCSASAAAAFDLLGLRDVAFVDAGGHIEAEWSAMGEKEWFESWFGDLLADGKVMAIGVETHVELLRKLQRDCGFPTSKDRWMVRTARTVAIRVGGDAALVSEDCDFYEPRAKQQKNARERHISRGTGRVAKALKAAGISPRCVAAHVKSA